MTLADELLGAPDRLLQEIDLDAGRLRFLPVDRERLERANFLDGRTEIATGAPMEIGLDDALAVRLAPPAEPDCYIFHVSFCGSTLLTRLLERPGKVFALREPHCLVTLADGKAKYAPEGGSKIAPLADFARATLRARWAPGEVILAKPSNWANNLLPELTADSGAIRPLFVGIGPRAFLRAVFRGNRERLAFTLRAAQHLATSRPAYRKFVAEAAGGSGEPLERAARLVLVALHIQLLDFRAAMAAGGWGEDHFLRYEEIAADPLAAATRANEALGLGLTTDELAEGIARNANRNAKIDGRAFETAEQDDVNDAVEQGSGRHFDAALAWAAASLPGWEDTARLEGARAAG